MDLQDNKKAATKAEITLKKFMDKNSKSVGANVALSGESVSGVSQITGFTEARFQDKPGGGTNMSCSVVNTFRTGGVVFPMNGNGVVVFPIADLRMYLLCFPVKNFLKEGIAIPDFAVWTESETGQEFVRDHMKVVVLTRGDVAFVPPGWIASPLFYEPPPEKTKGDGPPDERVVRYFASFPLFDPTAFGEKDGGSWTAWTAMTKEFWAKNTNDKTFVNSSNMYGDMRKPMSVAARTHIISK